MYYVYGYGSSAQTVQSLVGWGYTQIYYEAEECEAMQIA